MRGIRVQGIEQDIEGGRRQGARDTKQSGAAMTQPGRSDFARGILAPYPIVRQRLHIELGRRHAGANLQRQQGISGRNVVSTGMDASFQQRSGRTLGEVDNWQTSLVPATGSAQPSCAFQIAVPADAPQGGQTNMPSSICTSSSSTMRLPVPVFDISRGARLRRRGWERRSQSSARWRDS